MPTKVQLILEIRQYYFLSWFQYDSNIGTLLPKTADSLETQHQQDD